MKASDWWAEQARLLHARAAPDSFIGVTTADEGGFEATAKIQKREVLEALGRHAARQSGESRRAIQPHGRRRGY